MSQFETPPLPPTRGSISPSLPAQKPVSPDSPRSQKLPQSFTSQKGITLTEEANEIQRLIQTINTLPEVRQERINHIKTALQSGTYHIDSRDLADKIIKDLLDTHPIPTSNFIFCQITFLFLVFSEHTCHSLVQFFPFLLG
jgi:flagellar biosynthesis anti-sigma factor FlgM